MAISFPNTALAPVTAEEGLRTLRNVTLQEYPGLQSMLQFITPVKEQMQISLYRVWQSRIKTSPLTQELETIRIKFLENHCPKPSKSSGKKKSLPNVAYVDIFLTPIAHSATSLNKRKGRGSLKLWQLTARSDANKTSQTKQDFSLVVVFSYECITEI